VDDDEKRFSSLFETHYVAVVRFAARRTDDESARDVAAETFLTAWRRMSAVPREPEQRSPGSTARPATFWPTSSAGTGAGCGSAPGSARRATMTMHPM
jgi:hypothetical protein